MRPNDFGVLSVSNRKILATLLAGVALAMPTAAAAYIGPGLGAGAIAAALGVIGSIFLALVAVIYYPVKRLMGKKRSAKQARTIDNPGE